MAAEKVALQADYRVFEVAKLFFLLAGCENIGLNRFAVVQREAHPYA